MKSERWGLSPTGVVVLQEEETWGLYTYREKTMWGCSDEAAISKARGKNLRKTKPADTLILN